MSSKDIKILYENEMYVVCIKPSGITSEDGRVFAVKTVKPVDEEGAEAVFLKKEEARIRRAEKSRQKKLHGVE